MVTTVDKRQVTAYADKVVRLTNAEETAAAMDRLRLLCRRSGVDPNLLLAEARRRAGLRREGSPATSG